MRLTQLLPLAFVACAAAAQAQEVTIKIGQSGPLSGANAYAGKDDENGTRLAIEELNAKKISVAGKRIKFELLSEDDQGDPKSGVVVAQKFVDAGVKFVLGPYNSGVAIPAARIYNDAGIVMSTIGTNPKITASGYKLVFRITASDSQVGASMATYAARDLKLKNVGVIDDRSAFGQGVADQFIKEAKAQGLNVAERQYTSEKASDFNAILTAMRAKKVEAIFYGGYAPQAAPMARQMKALGLNAKLLGPDTLCTGELGKLGGDAVGENVLCAQGGTKLDKLAGGSGFKAKYVARFKKDPDVYAAPCYDQMMFIAEAMKQANSIDPSVVAAAMHTMSYKGVTGPIGYDEQGNMKTSAVTVYHFKNGEPVPVN